MNTVRVPISTIWRLRTVAVCSRGICFSIEPGIYMEDCGFRTEINCLISHEGVEVTTLPLQTEIKALL